MLRLRLRQIGILGCALPLLAVACATTTGGGGTQKKSASSSSGVSYDNLMVGAAGYIERGQPQRAEDLAKEAAESDPRRPEAYAMWGRALMYQRKLDPAAKQMEKARKRGSEDRQLYLELASVYDVSAKYDKAIDVYRAYLKLAPDDLEMNHELGLTLLITGKHEAAAQRLATALELAPSNKRVQLDYGYALLQSGALKKAETNLKAVLDAGQGDHEPYLYMGQLRAAQGRLKDAMRFLDESVKRTKGDLRPVRGRAKLRLLTGNAEGALSDYGIILKNRPSDAGAFLGAAGAFIALNQLDKAAESVAMARRTAGDHPMVAFRDAQVAWRKGNKAALDALAKLGEDNPGNLEMWREIAVAAGKLGNKALAQKAAKRVKSLER